MGTLTPTFNTFEYTSTTTGVFSSYTKKPHVLTDSSTVWPSRWSVYTTGMKPTTDVAATVVSGDLTPGARRVRIEVTITQYDQDNNPITIPGQSGPSIKYYSSWRTTAGSLSLSTTFPTMTLGQGNRYSVGYRLVCQYQASGLWFDTADVAPAKATKFYANRTPNKPTFTTLTNGAQYQYDDDAIVSIGWDYNTDPDFYPSPGAPASNGLLYGEADENDYGGFELQVRVAAQPGSPDNPWQYFNLYPAPFGSTGPSWAVMGVFPAPNPTYSLPYHATKVDLKIKTAAGYPDLTTPHNTLGPGTYQIRVRVFDQSGHDKNVASMPAQSSSAWSDILTFTISAPFTAPEPISPDNDDAIEVDNAIFVWQFIDPRVTGGTQLKRWVRVRLYGGSESDWVELLTNDTSSSQSYTLINGTGYTLEAGKRYQWQARTVSTPGNWDSGWTGRIASFWAVSTPGTGAVIPIPDLEFPDPGLGCGDNRAFVYKRGGVEMVGEITNMDQIVWRRVRDDISACDISIRGWSQDCGELLSMLRSWMYEIVVFRDNGDGPVRVWEGPITRISYEKDQVSIEAKDVMAYVYRRILRSGYNDSYRVTGRKYTGGVLTNPGVVISQPKAVTERAKLIIQNALSYDDPNVLAYMRVFRNPDDARQSRVVPAYSRTAWQEVDDMAAKSGLDYTTAGRRIMLWDTHVPIGLLPEMRDGDFDNSPIVTEYGMQLANYYVVTNNSGVYGAADRFNPDGKPDYYGYIEMLVSAYGESDGADAVAQVLTDAAKAALEESLSTQAERGIAARWPTPLIVRVPDNSTLNPDLNIGINQLIPGVHVPLRSDITLRTVSQMQKLDSVTVKQDANGETVTVTLSPAPNKRTADPDEAGDGDG